MERQTLFSLQKYCLQLMGHNMNTESEAKYLSLRHFASLLLVAMAQYPMICYTFYNRDNMELVTACLSVMFTNMLTNIKISTFLIYKYEFWQMMQQYNFMFNHMHHEDGKLYISKANKLASRLSQAYSISCGCTGLYFMLGPIIKTISSKIMHTSVVRELPMPMKFPFNDHTTPGYEIGYIYTLFVTITVVSYASAIDGLFISFAINLRAHFQALQHFISSNNFEKSQKLIQIELSNYVNYHVMLLDLAKKLRQVYMPIVFAQFLITSLQVCVIIYQIVTHMDNIMAMLVYFSFFSSIMLQLFLYCYGGEIIKIESLMVGIAVQLSAWYNLPPKHRRMLSLILQRSQRETLIKAGFYEASLANFMAIIRAALSYITLIQSIE